MASVMYSCSLTLSEKLNVCTVPGVSCCTEVSSVSCCVGCVRSDVYCTVQVERELLDTVLQCGVWEQSLEFTRGMKKWSLLWSEK